MDKPSSSVPDGGESSIFQQPIGRRALLKGASALGVAGLAAPWLSAAEALAGNGGRRKRIPIKHVVVDMQENRSFDHYYGFAPFAGKYGVPPGYSQPDGLGGAVSPITSRATRPTTSAIHGARRTPSTTVVRWMASTRTMASMRWATTPGPTFRSITA